MKPEELGAILAPILESMTDAQEHQRTILINMTELGKVVLRTTATLAHQDQKLNVVLEEVAAIKALLQAVQGSRH